MADLYLLAQQLGQAMLARGAVLATAESCTGGGIGAAITAIPGSSAWFDGGVISYSNRAKQALLGVSAESLAQYGAVSEPVVRQMAQGALQRCAADLAVAVSGIAGPDGGSAEKPVGTVWIAWAQANGEVTASRFVFAGDRQSVRHQTVVAALQGLLALAGNAFC